MDFIFDNIQVFIGIIVAIFWIIGKIGENKKPADEEQPWAPEDDDYQPDEYEPAEPPPIPMTRQAPPPPLPRFIPAPDDELQRQRAMQERLRNLRKEKAAAPAVAAKARAKARSASTLSPTGIKARLQDRKELRRAFVMREILDPPVSLR